MKTTSVFVTRGVAAGDVESRVVVVAVVVADLLAE
jgi:hypothetical protein